MCNTIAIFPTAAPQLEKKGCELHRGRERNVKGGRIQKQLL